MKEEYQHFLLHSAFFLTSLVIFGGWVWLWANFLIPVIVEDLPLLAKPIVCLEIGTLFACLSMYRTIWDQEGVVNKVNPKNKERGD